jgi:DNA-binding response OmpR family regulator
MRLLIVEDDSRMARLLSQALRRSGYAVDAVATGEQAMDYAAIDTYDLIVLDLGLPDLDGFEVCRHLSRQRRRVPILIVSARSEIGDRVRCLELGADDFLAKPFALEELFARVRALLRRRELPQQAVLTVGPLRLDRNRHRARVGRRAVELTAREYALLEYLLLNRGRVLTRTQIAEHVWEEDYDPTTNLIDVYVGRLRQKIDDDAARGASFLTTLRGVGYVVDGSASAG